MVNRNKSTFFYFLLAVVASVMVGMVLASRLDLTSQSSAQTAAPAVNSAPITGPVTATTFREVANMVSPAVVNIRTESLQQARDLSEFFGDDPNGLLDQFFGGGGRRTPLELHGLPLARQGAHGNAAGPGVGAEQVANEEIAPMKFLEVFIDHEPDKQVAAGFFLFVGREFVECFCQHLVSRTIPDLVNNVLLHLREGPGIPNRCAPLRGYADQADTSPDRKGDTALLEHVAI